MAEVGLAFLSGSLSVLLDRMTSREVLHFMQGRKQTEGLLRKLKNAMLSVKVVLEDSEEKQLTDSFVKDWVDELKHVVYDAEDILDEIATEALQSKLHDADAESPTVVGNLLNSFSALLIEPFFEKVDEKIEEVLDRLEFITKQKDCMGLREVGGAQEKPYPEGPSTSYVSQSDTIGRDDDKKKVIDLLLSSDASGNERCVIAIVGMGGIGKTTLAQLAYNDGRVKEHFNLKIWFCVSEKFVVPNVMKSIIDQSATSSARSCEDPDQQLQVTVQENLNGKKFLLVLDDVWSEKPKHREFLGQLLHYGTRGSTILVTTRNDSVALAMHAIATHHLDLLPKDDCWSLFEKHAFRRGSSSVNPKIKEIGTQIVKKCKGLPLAIKAIGDLLGSKSVHAERYWTSILKSNLWDIPMEKTNIIPALWLSYKYLPSNLKRCFAYCSIFPKDYLFEKDKLVLLWMAEGFLQQSEIETMEEVGNGYFDDLVSRSLFQQSSRSFKSGAFVMHDLVNDLAKSVTGEFGFTLESDSSKEIGEMTRYLLCFNMRFGFEKNEKHLFKAKQLRTLFAINSPMCHLSSLNEEDLLVPADSSIGLRVLSLPYGSFDMIIKSFDFSKMKHLRYLDFSCSAVNKLPNSICMLCNLQTLKLSSCLELERLPRDTWKLVNLRHLQINNTFNLKEMPIQIGRLKCLQTLSKFIVSKHDSGSSNIGELGKLINLRGNLLIQELQNVRSAKDASLKTKGYLEQLVLEWNHPKEALGISESQRDVLEDLQPHENLKCLTLKCYGGNGFPNWIGQGLPLLSELTLIDCKYCSAFPPLGQLHFLNKLYIDRLDEVVTVGPEFYGNSSNSSMKPFGTLKVLHLVHMLNWEDWLHSGGENEVETFSQLEKLYIRNCPKFRAKLPVHPSSLAKLEIINCKKLELPMHWQYSSLEELYLTDCCDSLMSFPLDLFPNLKSVQIKESNNLQSLEQHGGDHLVISKLRISKCPKFVSFPKGGLRAPNLAYFIVKDCESLRSMPDKMHIFLPSLCYLELENCPEVELFPEGGLPSNLKQIVIKRCKKLIANWNGWGLQILHSLEWLEIVSDKLEDHVESFPGGLLLPTTLTSLKISSFGNLKSLDKEGFQHLTSLVELVIISCPKLRYMPEEGFPTSLHLLKIGFCDPVLKEELHRKEGEEWLKVARIPNISLGSIKRIQGNYLRLVSGMRSPYQPPYAPLYPPRYEYEHEYEY